MPLAPGMDVGRTPYITDKKRVTVNSADGVTRTEDWYLFRVPIKGYTRKIGNIPDFKSIRFVRLFMSDFEDSVVVRLARLDLVRNQWRQFIYNLDTTGSYTPINTTTGTLFNTLAVNLEEIVGDIKDEFDEEESMIKKIDDFHYIIEGKTAIIDFCNFIDIPTNFFDAVKGESDTVAGLILELAGEFPTVQQVVKYKQFSFTALDIQKNRIHKIQSIITPITTISQENV